jgi:hypothetical protein
VRPNAGPRIGRSRAAWWLVGLLLVGTVALVVVDTIPDLIIRPYVSGRSLHVGMVMLAYVLGPLFFGGYGLFLGPPLLVLVFHFFRTVLPELIGGAAIRPYAVDPAVVTDEPARDTGAESTGARAADAATADGEPPDG